MPEGMAKSVTMATKAEKVAPPACAARLQAALQEVDALAARLADAERQQPLLTARAKALAEAAEASATALALRRMTDAEAEQAEQAAAEAERAQRQGERLLRGLRSALTDAECAAGALAEDANSELREWAWQRVAALDVEYLRAAEAAISVLQKITAIAGAAGMDHLSAVHTEAVRLPASWLDRTGRTLRVGIGIGDLPPTPGPVSEAAAETRMLVERAMHLRDRHAIGS